MNKAVVAISLLPLIVGFALVICIQETNIKEGVIQEKIISPKPPEELSPGNVTGWAFAFEEPKGIEVINVTCLNLNISVVKGGEVRVTIGKYISYNYTTNQIIWDETKIIFDRIGKTFNETIPIEGEDVNYLAIKNEGSNPVEVYSHVKKIGYIRERKYPYLGLGTLTILSGGTMLVYGLATTPHSQKRLRQHIR
jgi:hypothetical protein